MRNLWIILILYMLVLACNELVPVEPDPPIVEVKIPNVELTITPPGVLPYGAKCTIAWNSDFKNCTLNNKTVEVPNSMEVQLFANTNYIFTATNGSKSNSIEKIVTVGDWTTSKIGLLTYKPWMLKSWRYYQDDKFVADIILDNDQLTYFLTYLIDGTSYLTKSDGKIERDGDWVIFEKENKIKIGEQIFSIYSLTKNEFIIRIETQWYSKPALFEIFFYRP